MKEEKGFTLIELLIVIAIIGIIVTIATPQFMNALQKGKQKTTMANIRSIGTAIESYITDYYFAPRQATLGNISNIAADLALYTRIPATDGWGNPILYEASDAANPESYTILSYGRNGAEDAGIADGYPATQFEGDIIFQNGDFVKKPKS
ncbi:MAG: prepilin-type N-terminal cleavage/methylation domain-containing protein [Acidobacteriota bacterium]